jgi:hypothetical protein
MNEDARFGLVGTLGTITSLSLTQVNALLGCVAGVLTIIYVGLGVRQRWRNRDKPGE